MIVISCVVILVIGSFIGYVIGVVYSYSIRSCQECDERRRVLIAQDSELFPVPNDIEHLRKWVPNSRGLLLCRQIFVPDGYVKAVIGICHGFGDHSQNFLSELAVKFCRFGFAVITVDAEGHGLSDGLHGHVTDVMDIVRDFEDCFSFELSEDRFNLLPFFLYGESMGGAVAFNLCTLTGLRDIVKGLVLVAPMVEISDEMKLPPVIVSLLSFIAHYIPLAPITPIPDISRRCFRNPLIFERNARDSLSYSGMPRLGAALAMLVATEDISRRLHQLETPTFIAHGEKDVVTCPKISAALYDKCQSKDKVLKIYPDCWHGLMRGEMEPTASEIFNDVLQWISARVGDRPRRSPRKKR